ncbi:MAG: hypothetical protein AAF567_22375 [Actinomycetota bacterium]
MQIVGVGSQESFEDALDFLDETGLTTLPLLWERSGALWRLNEISRNSAVQLITPGLDHLSQEFTFNDGGRITILDASVQPPWSGT